MVDSSIMITKYGSEWASDLRAVNPAGHNFSQVLLKFFEIVFDNLLSIAIAHFKFYWFTRN